MLGELLQEEAHDEPAAVRPVASQVGLLVRALAELLLELEAVRDDPHGGLSLGAELITVTPKSGRPPHRECGGRASLGAKTPCVKELAIWAVVCTNRERIGVTKQMKRLTLRGLAPALLVAASLVGALAGCSKSG